MPPPRAALAVSCNKIHKRIESCQKTHHISFRLRLSICRFILKTVCYFFCVDSFHSVHSNKINRIERSFVLIWYYVLFVQIDSMLQCLTKCISVHSTPQKFSLYMCVNENDFTFIQYTKTTIYVYILQSGSSSNHFAICMHVHIESI